ncbi:MAG: type II toxin-antitoxin system Phd/YefM family antitoxin [Planctomycetota bacterium]
MGAFWQLQTAKNKLGELIDHALNEGPQTITRRGRKAVVVVSEREFGKLKKRKGSPAAFFRGSPLKDLTLERTKDLPRNVEE